jgi:fatty-acyl-CoA synthase
VSIDDGQEGDLAMTTMRYPLTLSPMLERAEQFFPRREIVSRTATGVVRYTYQQYGQRVRKLASALVDLGVRKGDRIATLAWNHHQHLEAYFAIPCIGAVLHTLNLRLPTAHLAHVINHAGDRIIIVDEDLVPLLEGLGSQLHTVERVIVITDNDVLPAARLPRAVSYEALLAGAEPLRRWPELDEWDPAGMCFSSATTGLPKGVTYTHRAIWLHNLAFCLADTVALSERDAILVVVPMYHANAWGIPFAATWMGAKLVLPGPRPDPKALCELIERERVTLAAGVPTVWRGVLGLLEKEPHDFSSLKRILCGGSAPPRAMIEAFEKNFGVEFLHAYGMTEATPLTHVSRLKSYMAEWSEEQRYAAKTKQGQLVPGLEMRIVASDGMDVPRDGTTMGEVWLRGPWIADEYYRDPRSAETFQDGWYKTGDVAAQDADGHLRIVDRMKDVVKSGGEWISTVDLENTIMAHPAVAEAAVVGVKHPKWQERPLACVVVKPGRTVSKVEIIQHLTGKFASWWLPDDVVFIDEVPKTSVGKFDKKVLREKYANHLVEREHPLARGM